MCRGRCGRVFKGMSSGEDGDISCSGVSGVHRGSEVLTARGGYENIVGVNGDVLMKRGEKEGVEDFLGDLGRSGRHGR